MRGVAATLVLVHHGLLIFKVGPYDEPNRVPLDFDSGWLLANHVLISIFNGSAAVVLFFVLSGAVLSLSLARTEQLGLREVLAFYLRRALRLGPLLVAVTLIAALLHVTYFTGADIPAATKWMTKHYSHHPGWLEIAANALGLSHSLNTPSWSILVEIGASLIFPMLYFLGMKRHLLVPAAAVLIVAMFVSRTETSMNTFFICFFVGALIPRMGAPIAARFYGLRRPARSAAVAAVLLTMAWFERLYSPVEFHHPASVVVTMLGAALLVAIVYHGGEGPVLRWRPLVALGEISYGVYLIHFVVMFAIAHAIGPHLPPALAPGQALALNLMLGAATFAVTVPLAVLSYRALEVPCQRLARAWSEAILTRPRRGRLVAEAA